jgi:hypothetical protein
MNTRFGFQGWTVASVLRAAWRATPPPLQATREEVAATARFLAHSGAGALAWRQVANSPWRSTPAAQELHQAFCVTAALNLCDEQRLQHALARLDQLGLDYLLIKGITVSRLYAIPELRPFGDIDLCVRPGSLACVRRSLDSLSDTPPAIDLQAGVRDLADRSWEHIIHYSRTLPVGSRLVRVLSPEDQLRLLCLHQARHGCWRPLWLCDVAAALENAKEDFDWERCLHGDECLTRWVLCVVVLVEKLLGATPPTRPSRLDRFVLPDWIVQQVLHTWGRGICGDSHNRDDLPMLDALRRPWRLHEALRCRWPNTIEAVFHCRGFPEDRRPKIISQAGVVLKRLLGFPRRLASLRASG